MVAVKMRITIKSEAKPQFSESVQPPLPNHTFTEAVNQSVYGHVLVSSVVKMMRLAFLVQVGPAGRKQHMLHVPIF